MKVVAIEGPGRASLVERPDPHPSGEFVVVRIRVAPMCTEYKAFRDGGPTDSLGHEASGDVVAVERSGRVRVGDRVVVMPQAGCGRCSLCLSGDYIHCQHAPDMRRSTGNTSGTATYAEYVVKQDWLLVPLPEDLTYEQGAMACCGLGPTFGAMRRMGVSAPDTILITGMGPVGLGGVINARARGAQVIAVEGQPHRARLAAELGAEAVLDPADPATPARIRELTGGHGADRGLDCSGAEAGQRLLIDGVRRRGEVCFVGEGGELSLHVSRDMLRKGLTLHGNWHYNLADGPRVLELVRQVAPVLPTFITHHFPMSRVEEAFALQLTGNCGKVVLDPGT